MKKKKKLHTDDAVTEILGTMLLLIIALIIFSSVYFSVLSMPQRTHAPHANIAFTFDDENIIISHLSGEALDPNTIITIRINDESVSKQINEFSSWDKNNDDVWGFGEKLVFSHEKDNIISKDITVTIQDGPSNSLVLFGNYHQPPEYKPSLNTKVNDISFYQSGPTLDISAAGDFMLTSVSLMYRYSSDNSDWTEYDLFEETSFYPWEWTFTFPEGFGWYEFYSIGHYESYNETPPSIADASCLYTSAPVISDIYPVDGAQSVELDTILAITLSDAEGDLMDLTWYSNASGSWGLIGSNMSIGDGTYYCDTFPYTSGYETTFYWNVSVTDGKTIVESDKYHFTTRSENNPPLIPYNENPPNESITSVNPILSWECSDPDGDTLTYDVYFGTSNPPPKIINNQSSNSYSSSAPSYDTTYYWKIVAWDEHGVSTEGPIWEFTTEDIQILTEVFTPSKDSYIQENSNSNYGNYQYLRVGFAYIRHGLIAFDVSSLSGKTIISAELRLYKYDDYYLCEYTNPVGRTYDVHRVIDNWNENGVRWNNRPDHDSTITDGAIVPNNNNNWMIWNVTNDVQSFLNGIYNNYGWLIKDNDELDCHSSSYFRSKEYPNENYRPVLEITYID
ncbi:MAG: DNRLRE domain-containing protein [Thermoplasmatota archaeon]